MPKKVARMVDLLRIVIEPVQGRALRKPGEQGSQSGRPYSLGAPHLWRSQRSEVRFVVPLALSVPVEDDRAHAFLRVRTSA
jgi:hypothetical protein